MTTTHEVEITVEADGSTYRAVLVLRPDADPGKCAGNLFDSLIGQDFSGLEGSPLLFSATYSPKVS